MNALATRAILKTETSTILQRIAERDKTAVNDCIDAYGNFIWGLARKFTGSREEAVRATEEIFIDIWRHCESARNTQSTEKKLIAMIALRRLIKSPRQAQQASMANIDNRTNNGQEWTESQNPFRNSVRIFTFFIFSII
jgi:DNA-directed RNA polymerase specialized sigma24 family protein